MKSKVIIQNNYQYVYDLSIIDDGALNMSSETVGVQQRIKELCEKAVYTHCCGHNLSLVVVSACKISVICNMLDTVKETSRLFVKVWPDVQSTIIFFLVLYVL